MFSSRCETRLHLAHREQVDNTCFTFGVPGLVGIQVRPNPQLMLNPPGAPAVEVDDSACFPVLPVDSVRLQIIQNGSISVFGRMVHIVASFDAGPGPLTVATDASPF